MFNENAFENGGYQSMSGIQTSHEEMEERHINSGSGSGALLELLAEVASQKLRSDPSVKYTNTAEPRISPRNIIQKGKSYIKKKRSSHRGRNHGIVDLEYVKALTANQLIKTFSEFDGDEMKKMFTYKCTFEPQHCNKHFASFGSEGKARQQLKIHLLEHVKKLEKNECEKYFSSSVRDAEYTQVAAKLKIETFTRTFHKEDICDENDSGLSNKELGRCIENNAINTYVLSPNSLRENNAMKREKSTSCCTADALQKTEFTEKSSYVSSHEEEKETIHDKIYNEHNYTTFGAKFCSASSEIQNSAKKEGFKSEDSDENCVQLRDFSMDNMPSKCLGKLSESDDLCDMGTVCLTGKNQFHSSQLPCVGQEVDVSTCVSLKNTEPGGHVILHNKHEKFDAKTTTFREVNKNVERDEYRLKKKPKGKAKFIGQSKAEKEMAIQMIDSMKRKENVVESLECHICNPPRTFTAPTTLISHYRSHAGIKPYECRLCRSVFTRQHSLNYHMLIHTNQTRFTCADCGRKFRHPSHFKEHRRRHTGESPYECSDCMLRFKTRNTYKRHLKTRHGKVLTTSGGLIVLSEEEFKSVRTSPRSIDSSNKSTTRKNFLKGKVVAKFSSRKRGIEQGGEDRKENKCITHRCVEENESLRRGEVQDNSDTGTYRNCETDYLENSSDSNDEDEQQHAKCFPFDDVVEVAMRQSNISFLDDKSDNSNDLDSISEKEFDSQKLDHVKSESYLEESVSTLNVTVKETYEADKKDGQFQKDVSNLEKATFLAGNSKCIAQLLPQPSAEPLLVTNSVALSPVFIETLFPDKQSVSSKLKDNHSSSGVLTVIRRQHCENSSQWRNKLESKHIAHESNEGRTVVVVANTS